MMSVDFATTKHAKGFPSNVVAQRYGAHAFHITLKTNTDNGNLVALGDWKGLDTFEEKAVTTFEGKILEQMSDGTWLVMVTNPGDALFVYEKPETPYDSPRALTSEHVFYNKAGDNVRAYELSKYDRIAVSAEGFSGTPAKDKKITGVTAKKMVVGA